MLRLFILSLLFVVGIGCQKRKAAPVLRTSQTEVTQEQANIVEDQNGLSPALYFIPILDIKRVDTDCRENEKQPIKNIQGQTITQVCESDYRVCVKQGTCMLNEPRGMRIINFTTRRGKIPLFSDKIKKECPYGLGFKDACLDPYYTVAADLKFHKLGEVIFVPTVRGMKLSNGDTHDGYFVIRDSGSNLKSEKRFDFFTGFDHDTEVSNVFKKMGLDNKENRFKYEKAPESIAAKVRAKRNYPKLNRKQIAEANVFIKKAMGK